MLRANMGVGGGRIEVAWLLALSALMAACGSEEPMAGSDAVLPRSSPSPLAHGPGWAAAQGRRIPRQNLAVRFDKTGAAVLGQGYWQLGLTAVGLRCDATKTALTPVEAETHAVEAKTSYRHRVQGHSLEEWYVNGPGGLEQGFTLSGLPCADPARQLSIEVQATGLTPQLGDDLDETGTARRVIRLVDSAGVERALYGDWLAYDAQQRPLPLEVTTDGNRIVLTTQVTAATWPITIDPTIWVQRQKMIGGTQAGIDLACSGDTVLVGTVGPSAPVYVRSGGTWSLQKELKASNVPGTSEIFGRGVAVDGDTAVVGAPYVSPHGAVYVFTRSGTTWTEKQILTGVFGDEVPSFGADLAISGDTVLVSAGGVSSSTGQVHVFVRSGTTWSEQKILKAPDGAPDDDFGQVALSGDTALIGAFGHAANHGAAYIFVRNAGVWSLQTELAPNDLVEGSRFGGAVALSGDTALIGGNQPDNASLGAAYVFTRSGSTWSLQQKLVPTGGTNGMGFGRTVALLGNQALIGSYFTYGAYPFVRSGITWTQQNKLVPDNANNPNFGSALAIGTGWLFVGDYHQNTVYAYESGFDVGDACTTDAECGTKHCVEKVCCDTTCTGTCQSCLKARKASGADGVCGLVKAGTDPLNQCAATPVSGCGLDGLCNAAGACERFPAGSECAAASCPTSKSQNLADSCDGSGTCVVTPVTACQVGYVCAAGACSTTCQDDAACDQAGGYRCIGGKCLIAQGQPCKAGDVCETGHCADGVCCDEACGGACAACLKSLTGEADGSCAPIPSGQDPQNECAQDAGFPGSCGADGQCNGERACRPYAIPGLPCGAATSCTGGKISGEVCSGAGTCSNDTIDCGVYRCDSAMTACADSCKVDEDCSPSAYCVTGGTCTPKKKGGVVCSVARECASDFCVDGVCCNGACDGQCASCAESGSEGKCLAVTGEPRAGRPACDGDDGDCRGSCDGQNDAECSYPSQATVCGRGCSGEGAETLSECNGAGACESVAPTSCGNYLCKADRCMSACESDGDCQMGFGCTDMQCVPQGGRCSDDDTKSRPGNGGPAVPCAPYSCNPDTGACRTTCASSAECSQNFACNVASGTCIAASGQADEAGCACRAAGGAAGRPPRPLGLALLCLSGILSLRRAGRRRFATLLAAVGLLGCTDGAAPAGEQPDVPATATSATLPPLLPLDSQAEAQQTLRRSFIRSRQAEARPDARFRVASGAGPAPTADNPAIGLSLTFRANGPQLRSGPDWELGLSASALHCGSERLPLQPAEPEVGAEPNRVAYRRQLRSVSIEEWYENGPLGLEQGFTLSASPCWNGATQLGVDVQTSGLRPLLESIVGADGQNRDVVKLLDIHGIEQALYSDWLAYDAHDRPLPTAVAVNGERLTIQTDVSGAVWPVTIDPLIWTEKKKLSANDRTVGTAGYFGASVALNGNTALIGANADASYKGAAYVKFRTGAAWSEQKKLVASDGAPNDWFGYAVALSGNTALVGAYHGNGGGSAYVYDRTGAAWAESKKLAASDAAAAAQFGFAVAIDGDRALIGAPTANSQGAVYVFERAAGVWSEKKKLTASDGASGDNFGSTVALSGGTALVGAYNAAATAGAAYVYVGSGTNWSEEKKLTGSTAVAADAFGRSVALSGNTAVVGAPFHASNLGAAYVFLRSGTTWGEQKVLVGGDSVAGDVFGWSVAISGNMAAVGARGDDGNTGAVFAFTRSGVTWTEAKKLVASDRVALDNLGISVSVDGDVLSGAQYKDGSAGVAYVFGMALQDTDACAKDEDCVSQHCVENVCCNTACSGTCQTCLASRKASGADGVCGNVKSATDPRDACAAANVSGCGFDGSCNGAGGCSYYPAATECDPAACPSTTQENLADKCNGSGTCVVAAPTNCKPGYVCTSGACKTSCAGNADCNTAAGYVCNGNKCQIPKGAACGATDVCETGYCADGVCCDTACAGTCNACLSDATGQPDGTCGPALPGKDPRNECTPDVQYPESCREDGACDGSGACRAFAVVGTVCGAATCSKGTVSGEICDGSGQCATAMAACAQYTCDDAGLGCRTSCVNDDDCSAGAYCITGTCADKKPLKSPCTQANECDSGVCADAVCCDRACDGQCEGCAEPTSVGVCQTISGEPRGERKACNGSGSTCGGTCDGNEPVECSYPAPSTECARTCSAARESVSSCDGAGVCVEGNSTSCGDYACGADRCLTECGTDDECQAGFSCKSQECVAKGAKCLENGVKSQDIGDDSITECFPYLCEASSGLCLAQCRASTDCAAGHVCNAANQTCEEVKAAATVDEGCGCSVPGAPHPEPMAGARWLGLLALLGAAASRRHQARARATCRTRPRCG